MRKKGPLHEPESRSLAEAEDISPGRTEPATVVSRLPYVVEMETPMSEMERPPREGKGAIALKIAEAGISMIPVIGGPLSVLSEFLAEPYSRRRQRWLEQLAEVVSELRDRVEDLSKPLEENEQFLTAVLHANAGFIGPIAS